MNSSNVSAAKPKVGGAIHVAPVGTQLPTDATAALDAAFKDLGYASEDGVTNSSSPESESIRAWGGDIVLTPLTSKEDTFSFTLIEALNVDTLKLVYGDSNVSGTLAAGITIKANAKEPEEHAFVIDMILNNNALKRIVIPKGKVTEVGEVVYQDAQAIGYNTTLSCGADSEGNTHYEYIKAASAS